MFSFINDRLYQFFQNDEGSEFNIHKSGMITKDKSYNLKQLLNYVEDRRIDNYIYKSRIIEVTTRQCTTSTSTLM